MENESWNVVLYERICADDDSSSSLEPKNDGTVCV